MSEIFKPTQPMIYRPMATYNSEQSEQSSNDSFWWVLGLIMAFCLVCGWLVASSIENNPEGPIQIYPEMTK